jgi:hypothetical protein
MRRLAASLAWILLLATATAEARPTLLARGKLAAGGAVGLDWPLAQDDAEPGPAFALLFRYGLSSRLALEPSLWLSLPTDGQTPSGADVEAPRLLGGMCDALLRSNAFGFALTARAGLGAIDVALPGDSDAGLRLAAAAAVGVEFGFGPLTAQFGPRLLLIENDGGTRKNVELRLGALYHFN